MKKSNWRILNNVEKKSINGGYANNCETANDCYDFTVEQDGDCFREFSCQQSTCVAEELICG